MKTAGILSALFVVLVACGGGGDAATAPGRVVVSVSDDFERATLGPDWDVLTGAATILGGSDLGLATTSLGILGRRGQFGDDQFSEGVVTAGFNPQDAVQVFVRRESGSAVRYGFLFRPDSLRYQLKYDGINPGQVLVAVTGPTPAPGDVLRIEARGTSLRGLVNGVLLLETTHNVLTSGNPGMAMVPFSGVAPARFWESWRGGTLP